jgi:squalene-hopene/tetraprenyl-beta-curcumene cyclase
VEWVRMVQNTDGGWGETCGTYDDPGQRGIGPSTPSQTAWALLALLAGGDTRSDSVAKGVRWLVDHQAADGSWSELIPGRNGESYYTGTGFPRVFYLGYHLYKQYFPLLALTTYDRLMSRGEQ